VEPDGVVLAAVSQLPPRQRAAIVLTYFADLPEAEVAAALGCKPGTVKSQLSKARATLAGLLAEPPEADRG
jgi:RNA polymerase sigma factor (sigma-70 family)